MQRPPDVEQLMTGISRSLSAFFPGLSCQNSGDGVLFVFAEGRLISNLMVAELLGPTPDQSDMQNVLYQALNNLQDDLLRDWGRWQTPSLAAQVDAIKLALPEVWQDGGGWRWSYCLPNGELLELRPVQL